MTPANYKSPDVLLLVGTHCPHCPVVLAAMADLVKAGEIGQLEVVNIEQRPDRAAALGVRSVPWIRIGGLTLTGLHSKMELQSWVNKAGSMEGMADYLVEMLETGQVSEATAFVEQEPRGLDAVIHLLGDPQQKINVKVGLGVIMEGLAGSERLQKQIPALGVLTQSPSVEVRADACHYLGLTHSDEAKSWLEKCLDDEDQEVREIARESLDMLEL